MRGIGNPCSLHLLNENRCYTSLLMTGTCLLLLREWVHSQFGHWENHRGCESTDSYKNDIAIKFIKRVVKWYGSLILHIKLYTAV